MEEACGSGTLISTPNCPHRRYNPLKGSWVLVSPNRLNRPWDGKVEKSTNGTSSSQDTAANYLSPGATRSSGRTNPMYTGVYVFDNDFPAFLSDSPPSEVQEDSMADPLFNCQIVSGTCRVICYHPSTSMSLPRMTVHQVLAIVHEWIVQLKDLGSIYPWVQIFENRGQLAGCSNAHPHGQIWATSYIPSEIHVEDTRQRVYQESCGGHMLEDYTKMELEAATRVVIQNEDWVVVVPYWAMWPFETLLLPKRRHHHLTDLGTTEQLTLADILIQITSCYDGLFDAPFHYSMGWHFSPGRAEDTPRSWWGLHAHFYPPMLRSAVVQKFVAGFELLSEPQRDLTAEVAAERLRSSSKTGR